MLQLPRKTESEQVEVGIDICLDRQIAELFYEKKERAPQDSSDSELPACARYMISLE